MHRHIAQPRYLMLADNLRRRIEEGAYKPGDRLPSEAQLCADHGVSRGTVVRAIEQLVSDGIVHRRQGAGSFVARPSLHRRAGNLLSFTESAAGEGKQSQQTLIALEEASEEQVREFDCDGPALYLCRLRLLDGLPCAIHRSIVPAHVARRIDALNGDDRNALNDSGFSLYHALEEAGFKVREARERVTTRLANAEETRLLGLDDPAAVMVVFRRSFDGSGRLVEAVEAVYHGEYYTYDMRLVSTPSEVADHDGPNILSLGGRVSNPADGRT
ncbi:GntR family transcriptional regulator [Hoeflea sp.]|uniref:GntR family transcriptional regulator n=1 Tax=Hoeflea sp. TaxID=1940281 RepID=UPI003B02915D